MLTSSCLIFKIIFYCWQGWIKGAQAFKQSKLGPCPMGVTLLETLFATGRAQWIHIQLLQEISVAGALNLVNLTAKLLSNPSPCSYLWVLEENLWENLVQNHLFWLPALCFKWQNTFSQENKKQTNDPKTPCAMPVLESMELQQFIVMTLWQMHYSGRREQLGNLLQLIQTANEGSVFSLFEETSRKRPPPI